MRYTKLCENTSSDQEIHDLCEQYGIDDYNIVDGKVDVNGVVNLSGKKLVRMPVQFGVSSQFFRCDNNKLTTLVDTPEIIDGSFWCSHNNLSTLFGGPKIVEGNFLCSRNPLTSLEGCPQIIRGKLSFRRCQLEGNAYRTIVDMDYFGEIDTGDDDLSDFINDWLTKFNGDLATASNKLHFSVALTRYLRDNQ